MKSFLKRAISLLLCMVLVLSFAGCGKEKSAQKMLNREESFSQIVSGLANQYGILDSTVYMNTAVTGLCLAEKVDITEDGKEELVCIYKDFSNINVEIYEHRNGFAVCRWSDSVKWGNEYYFSVLETEDGIRWARTDAGPDGAGTKVFKYENRKYVETVADYHASSELMYFQSEYGIEDYANSLKAEWDIRLSEMRETRFGALSAISYFGNASGCKMTKEMAEAYIEAIKSEEKYVKENMDSSYKVFAALVDSANDGMPVLVTAVSDGYNLALSEDRVDIGVWTWDGKKAERYDFVKDLGFISLARDYQFVQSGMIGAKLFVSEIPIGGGPYGESSGYAAYQISNAQLTLVESNVHLSAIVDYENPDYVLANELVGVDPSKYEKNEYGEYRVPKADLIAAGWILDDYIAEYGGEVYVAAIRNGERMKLNKAEDYGKGMGEMLGPYRYDQVYYYPMFDITSGSYGLLEGWQEADVTIENLEKYAKLANRPVYAYHDVFMLITDAQREAIIKEVLNAFDGEIGEIFKLSKDLYYVTVYDGDTFVGGVIVKNIENGTAWRTVTSKKTLMSEEELNAEAKKDNSVPNIKIDFSKTKGGEKHLSEVLENIDGSEPNDAAKEDIYDYIKNYISNSSEMTIKVKDNKVTIDEDAIYDGMEKAYETLDGFEDVLYENGVVLNKEIAPQLNVTLKGVKDDSSIRITLDEDIRNAVYDAGEVMLILGDTGIRILLSRQTLDSILSNREKVIIEIKKVSDDGYEISFTDENKSLITQLESGITFILPASGEFSSVQFEDSFRTENWGGQYDEKNKAIVFMTPFAGKYTVIDKTVDISDISNLSAEHQKAIMFMVSKGFFSLDGDKFNPDGTLTRYAFSEAVVRMFFATDHSLKTAFLDVTEDNPYYPYVAAGEKTGTFKGYDDGMFHGEYDVLRQEVIAICKRTLCEKKGYAEPENPADYLHFTDNSLISTWARPEVSLAVREKLIDDGGVLRPTEAISRADSALILYRLFMLLYEVESADAVSSGVNKNAVIIAVSSAIVLVLAAVVVLSLILIKKTKAKKEEVIEETEENTEEKENE